MTPLEEQLKISKERFEALRPGEFSESARQCITALGASHRALGMWDEALRIFDIGLSRSAEADDKEATSRFLISKSCTYYHMGNYERAIGFAAEGVGLPISDSKRGEYVSYYLANPYLTLGDIEKYFSLQEMAVEITKGSSGQQRRELEPWILCRLARGFDMLGDSERANLILVEQAKRFRNIKQTYGIPFSLLILGRNLLHLGRLDEARQTLEECLKLYEKNCQEGFVVDAMAGLSEVALAMGDNGKARDCSDRAIREARQGPRKAEGLADKRHLNQALIQSAKVYLHLKERDKAVPLYDEALELAVASNRRLMIAELLELQNTQVGDVQGVEPSGKT